MEVNPKRQLDCRVAKTLADRFDRGTFAQEHQRVAVPHGVELHAEQLRDLQDRVKDLADQVALADVCACLGDEAERRVVAFLRLFRFVLP